MAYIMFFGWKDNKPQGEDVKVRCDEAFRMCFETSLAGCLRRKFEAMLGPSEYMDVNVYLQYSAQAFNASML